MDEEQVREIAQQAFTDINMVRVNVKRSFDRCDGPTFEVGIVRDAEFEQLNAAGTQPVQSDPAP